MQSPGQRRESLADHAAGASGPTLKVAAVARRLGVAPATLRTWARRYGVGPPAHTAGAHRQYTADDLSRLLVMRRLTLEGVAPAEAARIALSAPAQDDEAPATPAPLAMVKPPPEPAGRTRRVLAADAGGSAGVRRDWSAAHDPAALVDLFGDLATLPDDPRELVAAARSLDAPQCRRRLLGHVQELGVVGAWEQVIRPALRAVGDYCAGGGGGHEVELVLTECVTAVLQAGVVNAAPPAWGTALLACVRGERHGLPLQALAAALAERRVGCLVLGSDVPHAAVRAAVDRLGPKVVVLFSASGVDPDQLEELPDLERTTRLLVGGDGWLGLQVPDGAVHARSLEAAVDQVRLAVRH